MFNHKEITVPNTARYEGLTGVYTVRLLPLHIDLEFGGAGQDANGQNRVGFRGDGHPEALRVGVTGIRHWPRVGS
ncbi:hypothetical protein [Streptomyces sp. NBC_01373]|uniref:hypothetical protein n=1 Tax=unclassified Streptomyces TaxID=2593676 RepID=UPI00225077E1|nr:hypothetical protein [Streptomyces sp. NBC_01373]MCX4702738.1 hypothetical protein [Streptomyces sp. NBC_01373]